MKFQNSRKQGANYVTRDRKYRVIGKGIGKMLGTIIWKTYFYLLLRLIGINIGKLLGTALERALLPYHKIYKKAPCCDCQLQIYNFQDLYTYI